MGSFVYSAHPAVRFGLRPLGLAGHHLGLRLPWDCLREADLLAGLVGGDAGAGSSRRTTVESRGIGAGFSETLLRGLVPQFSVPHGG